MTPADRAQLDLIIHSMISLSDGFTIDDFRLAQQRNAKKTARRIKSWVGYGSVLFLILAILDLFLSIYTSNQYSVLNISLWAIALGGLGASASIFLDLLKLIPQQTLRNSDEFEVIGRIMLGILFSFVLTFSLGPQALAEFFKNILDLRAEKPNIMLIVPFVAGYSLPLVLGLLDKSIRAIELTLGLDDRRTETSKEVSRLPKPKKVL